MVWLTMVTALARTVLSTGKSIELGAEDGGVTTKWLNALELLLTSEKIVNYYGKDNHVGSDAVTACSLARLLTCSLAILIIDLVRSALVVNLNTTPPYHYVT